MVEAPVINATRVICVLLAGVRNWNRHAYQMRCRLQKYERVSSYQW